MDQLNPAIDVLTPLGPAIAVAMDVGDTGQALWLVFVKATGEPWYFRNPHIRLAPDISDGHTNISPFLSIPDGLKKHIERYEKNGWLPAR